MNRLRTSAVLLPKFTGLRLIPDKCLQIVSHNVRSLKLHIDSIRNDTIFQASHILLLQETWIKNTDDVTSLQMPGKNMIIRNRLPNLESKGKGTIIYGIPCSNLISHGNFDRKLQGNNNYEIDITACQYDDLYIINIYKSNGVSVGKLIRALVNVENSTGILSKNNILLCGDFNDNISVHSAVSTILKTQYGLNLLSPLKSTTDRGTCIDGIYGKLSEYNYVVQIYESYYSDHKPLVIRLNRIQSTGLSQTLQCIDI